MDRMTCCVPSSGEQHSGPVAEVRLSELSGFCGRSISSRSLGDDLRGIVAYDRALAEAAQAVGLDVAAPGTKV